MQSVLQAVKDRAENVFQVELEKTDKLLDDEIKESVRNFLTFNFNTKY